MKTALRLPLIAALLTTCVAAHSAPVPAAPPTAGELLFAEARNTWLTMHYPPRVDYIVAVTAVNSTTHRTDRYDGEVQPASGDFRVRGFSDYEDQHPHTPRGIDVLYTFGITMSSGMQPVNGAGPAPIKLVGKLTHEEAVEPFAVPELSPIYSFGMLSCAQRRVREVEPAGGPAVIGAVTTVNRRYRIEIAGNETIDSVETVHLTLVPLQDPDRDRLRDLWLTAADRRPFQARVHGNFTGNDTANVPWLIRFATVDGATYIATEQSEAPVTRGKRTFDRVTIAFEQVRRGGFTTIAFALPYHIGALNAVEEPPEPGGSCTGR